MLCRRLAFYRSCRIDDTAIEKKFLCERCLTCIRMRDDRKCSSLFYFIFNIRHTNFLSDTIAAPALSPALYEVPGDSLRTCLFSLAYLKQDFNYNSSLMNRGDHYIFRRYIGFPCHDILDLRPVCISQFVCFYNDISRIVIQTDYRL